jgi:hypothetical protein
MSFIGKGLQVGIIPRLNLNVKTTVGDVTADTSGTLKAKKSKQGTITSKPKG